MSEKTKYFFHPHPFDRKTAEKLTGPEIDDPDIKRYMAVEDTSKEMIGYVFFWDFAKDFPWLGISVRDDFQGKGLGKKLLNFMEQVARNHNKKGIQLTTMKDNEIALHLYKKMEYKIVGEKHGEHWLKYIF